MANTRLARAAAQAVTPKSPARKRPSSSASVSALDRSLTMSSVKDFLIHLEKFRYVNKGLWYRGVGNAEYQLLPSLFRNRLATSQPDFQQLERDLNETFQNRSVPYTGHTLSSGLDWDRIDFDPTYQRKGRRWSTSDKQYLIDSILNGFDIPKFYVADFTWGQSKLNEQKKAYAVIDGKQRFEAIFEFFNDDFPLSHTFSLLSSSSLKLGGKKYSQLKASFPDVAEVFENFNPSVVGVLTDDISFVEELFVRLNRSKPTSGAEIRNAVSTPVSQMVRTIGSHPFFNSYVKFNTGKGQNLNCAAKLLMFEALGLQETKKSTLDRFSSASNNEHQKVEKALPIVLETLGSLIELFQFKDPLLNSEGPIPIYYWLARNANELEAPYVRDFLEYFQALLKTTPTPKSKTISLSDWNSYKVASRSINDKSSHELRYGILVKYFQIWLAKNVV